MNKLEPIGLDTQLDDVLSGIDTISEPEKEKIAFVKDNIQRVSEINNSKVYNVSMDDESIYYYLRKNSSKRYYYPVKYASIELNN